jgi:DNA helicase-2/ATP-dependent DNA helicase PcrA
MPFADTFGGGAFGSGSFGEGSYGSGSYGRGSFGGRSYGSGSYGEYRKSRRENQRYNERDEYSHDDDFGSFLGGRRGGYSGSSGSGGFGKDNSGGFGMNSYGLSGMGSTGYTGRSGSSYGSGKKAGSGIPKSLQTAGVQKLNSLDYKVGDTVSHIKFGKGTVLSIVDGKKDFEVTVDFEKAGQKKMFASFAKLKKI